MVKAGVLAREGRGVYRLAVAPGTWEQSLLLAQLRQSSRAVASHRAAARIWELEGFEQAPVELTVPRNDRRFDALSRVHESRDLESRDLTRLNGIAVTNPARTLVDLGAVAKPHLVELAVDDALRRGLTTVDRLEAVFGRVARRGRAGVGPLRQLLDQRAETLGRTESGFETRLLRVLLDHGLPAPVPQYELRDGATLVARFDFAYPERRIGLEADSERWHTSSRRFVEDRTRRARAESLGWRVLSFTWHHVTRQPRFIADTVRDTYNLPTA